MKLFSETELLYEMNAAFIYELDQMKYFAGKKMQKKRNQLNYYKSHYLKDTTLVKYHPKYFNEAYKFIISNGYDHTIDRWYEVRSAGKFLSLYDSKNSYGTLMYYQNLLIGFTYGYVFRDIYEIFIEKANHVYKGSSVYLISENLIINDVKAKYVDRQDDMGIANLTKSKMSFHPIAV